ncbi:MAG: DNA helicase-2/ATP-dependent DNA helicase PcrA [Lentisphaeria bacterium]|jgi:DNA helicase-2/ATP-dependent DNA helicase PcrA
MNPSELIADLNDAQRQAVCAPPNHQLVLAGAGSGKTRVLVHRISWLIQVERCAPHEILAVTFTNKTAREMRERLNHVLGEGYGGLRGMWVGTFHGIAHRLLKAHWKDAGLPQNFQILDSDDQLRLIKRIYSALDIDEERWPYKQTQWFINSQKDEGIRPQYIEEGHDPYLAAMKTVYSAYEEACARGGMIDFAEILLRSHELWLKHPSILRHYQERFRFMLVDEFQDTNAVQYAWLRVLAGQTCKVTAVGDDDQSIYGWRGAKIENIQSFETHFTPVEITRLEQNYRSSANILKAANAVIENNVERMGKSLWTSDAEGELIDLYAAFNEQDEARYIVDRIKSWINTGGAASAAAILYRSNAQSRVIEESLIREDIPYTIYGGQRFYERLEIKNALAYMRLITNRNDDAAFERIVNTPTRGVGNKTLETLRLFAREQGTSLYQATLGALSNSVFTARAANALTTFIQLIEELEQGIESKTLPKMMEYVVTDSGLLNFHQMEKGERGQARVENLQELINACNSFEADEEGENGPLQDFLDRAALDAGDSQADEFEDAVQMMTLHSAKGLEFPLVFLAGVEENLFPHRMSIDEPGRLEEERRLCYVGITRAMKKLVISFAESRRMYGDEKFNTVSRFVREIPREFIQEVRIKSSVTRPVSFSASVQKSSLPEQFSGMSLGQSVRHSLFGDGVILQFEGQGAGVRVQVNFGGQGSKWLVLQYAKLELI